MRHQAIHLTMLRARGKQAGIACEERQVGGTTLPEEPGLRLYPLHSEAVHGCIDASVRCAAAACDKPSCTQWQLLCAEGSQSFACCLHSRMLLSPIFLGRPSGRLLGAHLTLSR